MKQKAVIASALLVSLLAVAGCKKEGGQSQTIELPEGRLHLGSQWVDGQLWVESFDPQTRTCSFSEYRKGKPVESSTVTFTKCRTGLGGPAMRPMMDRQMMERRMEQGGAMRPNMPPRPGRVRPNAEQPPVTPTPQSEPAPVAPPPQG